MQVGDHQLRYLIRNHMSNGISSYTNVCSPFAFVYDERINGPKSQEQRLHMKSGTSTSSKHLHHSRLKSVN